MSDEYKLPHGGPAFPTISAHQNGPNTYQYEGMTLRDYFAAKAMQSCIVDAWRNSPDMAERPYKGELAEAIASDAYVIADAMLAERVKQKP